MNHTHWGHESSWYKDVPKSRQSNHQLIIFPKLIRIITSLFNKEDLKDIKAIDLACGTGDFTNELNGILNESIGIDLGRELIETAIEDYKNKFFVEDCEKYSEKFKKEYSNYFDLAFSILAIQNIRDFNKVLNELNSVLKSGGKFIFVINHPAFRIPKISSWGFKGKELQYRIIEKYMTNKEIPIVMHPGSKDLSTTYSFHRPLEYYFHCLKFAGYKIIDIEEWVSPKKSEKGPREKAENTARKEIPLFLTIIAEKA